jgi:hypothetical protein
MELKIETVDIVKDEEINFILGQSHFVKTVEDLYEAMVNVLYALKAVPEVCTIFCASANPTSVVVADNGMGRGIMGVIDGEKPAGIETEEDVSFRKDLLRKFGYKM